MLPSSLLIAVTLPLFSICHRGRVRRHFHNINMNSAMFQGHELSCLKTCPDIGAGLLCGPVTAVTASLDPQQMSLSPGTSSKCHVLGKRGKVGGGGGRVGNNMDHIFLVILFFLIKIELSLIM
jgi:hypothetical protein